MLPRRIFSGNLVDVIGRSVRPGSLIVEAGRIVDIRWDDANYSTFLIPGFVDAHIHVESSLLPPREFARLAVVHGTVATVSDPHEIANVLGTAGVDYMLDDARGAPLKIHFGAPSCVPATPFDCAGASLAAPEVAGLLDRPEIKYLAEMMNYPGVIAGDSEVSAKLAASHVRGKPVDGHAPRLRGEPLAKYAAAGITTDHECFTLPEAIEKLSLGIKVIIREGSAARNFDELVSLLAEHPDRCMLCSDDKHPHQLIEGHIDQLVRRAVARGIDVMDALRAACVNPVLHYGLDVGLLRRGDAADFLEVDDLEGLRVRRVFIDGRLVAADGRPTWPRAPSAVVNQFHAVEKRPDDFEIPAPANRPNLEARVIEVSDGQLVTGCSRARPAIADGRVIADPQRDLLKITLVDRYQNRRPVTALVKNFGLKRGAVASSVAHDSHSIVAVGTNDADLCRAVNRVIASRGGLAAVAGTTELVLPLPIAGLMSDDDGPTTARRYAELEDLAKSWGSTLEAPFMTLSFMALTVIPSLKLGPAGLFDVDRFAPVELFWTND